MKRYVFAALSLLFLAAAAAVVWSVLPPQVDRETPDQALILINSRSATDTAFEEAYFEHRQHRLHYVHGGAGPAVVFIHGFPSFWFSLSRQIEHLAEDYRVIAIDGLGAGKSDAPRDEAHYELEAMSRHILALLDALQIEQAHLIGHDWGSALAIGMAQRHPSRVLTVTGISAPALNAVLYGLETDSSARATAGYVERLKKANPLLLLAFNAADSVFESAYQPLVDDGNLSAQEGERFRHATSDPRRINAHINWYRANIPAPDEITEADFWPARDARVAAPALYIWGEADPIYNQNSIDRLLALSDDAELLLLPKLGHWPHVREADSVNAAIRRHLRKVTRP